MPRHPVNDIFNQPPALENFNRFEANRALRDAVRREGADWAAEELAACGAELGSTEWIERGRLANDFPPRLNRFDRFGHTVNTFEFHPAWHQCLNWINQRGLAGASWDDDRSGAQVRRSALFQLFAEVECGSLCPATMTHGAVPVLARAGGFAEPWLKLLREPVYDQRFMPIEGKRGALMGMGLTERQGGSDVRANTSRAEPDSDGWYRLHGHKWFFSAAMCDAFLVTAQAPQGLTCFFLPRFTPDGEENALRILRDKDKLGDRANASAEVEFHGALVRRVGEEGRGIATVLEMANYTRLDCANGSVGIMRSALSEALQCARYRKVFGKTLDRQPLMVNVLADLALEMEGHTALCLRVAACLDAQARDPEAALLQRLLIPIAKYWVCKRAPTVIAEAMEVTGGNGYVETGPMPRLFRQSPLNSIWEGAGNIMCLDVLRVLARDSSVLALLFTQLEGTQGLSSRYDWALADIKQRLTSTTLHEGDARWLVERLALIIQASLLLADGASPLAEAFCRSRLGERAGRAFGCLEGATDFRTILDRAMPV
ncbi:MAG: hypothetical protein VR73_14670 [Gammaproteobacteria bacterium BRH_c0]|nr:MAG: hypothetical protein VR73_14670 [Gammaproteobacteria bacterium BRH_c0]